jgi:rod shape-determining protein MreC
MGYVLMAVVLMVVDHRGQALHILRKKVDTYVDPMYWLAETPVRVIRLAQKSMRDHALLSKENTQLREKLLLSEASLARLASIQEQNNRLRILLNARSKLGLKAQLGELIGVDLDPYRHRILLNLGHGDGITKGRTVMDAHGVLGQILEVRDRNATVILITDPSHAIPVRVLRTGLRTIAYGSGSLDKLSLPHIPFSAGVREGDQLMTSGMGGHFPAGLPVGIINKIEPDSSAAFVLASARPSADLTHNGEVLVVHNESEFLLDPTQPNVELEGPPELMIFPPLDGTTPHTGTIAEPRSSSSP